jgi:putative DNA primase/helicase
MSSRHGGGSSVLSARRRKPQPVDFLDPSGIVNAQAERELLAALMDCAAGGRAAAATAAADTLSADVFTIAYGADVFRAIVEATRKPTATVSDIRAALLADLDRQGLDHTAAMAILVDLVGDKNATGPSADRIAAERAVVVRELHTRRQTVYALGDALRRVHDDRPMPDELAAAARSVAAVAELAAGRKASGRKLRVRTAAEIEPKPIEWLWPKRICRGALTIITGMPGLSKSLLTIDIAARITTGGKWPDGSGSAPRGGVILFGMEDDPERVVVPRLKAAAADLELVRIVDGAEDGREDWLSPVNIERDLDLVREQLDAFSECRALVFDPLSQFIECDENSNGQTRAALAPLVTLAQERGVSIIGVMHVNKKTDSALIHRIAGAGSYGQMARQIIFVGHDPDDRTTGVGRRRGMVVSKSSYGGQDTGQLYRVITRSGDLPGIEWGELIERDAESFVPKPAGGSREYEERRGEAVDSLRDALAGGPRPGRDVEADLDALGFGRRQIDYASRVLKVEKRQDRDDKGRRAWIWSLPTESTAEPDDGVGAVPLDEWGRV